MTGRENYFVMGGDERFAMVANGLAEEGKTVSTFGLEGSSVLDPDVARVTDWKGCLREANVVILPLPVTQDQVRLHTPLGVLTPPRLDQLAGNLSSGAHVFGGRIQEKFLEKLERVPGVSVTDYYANESLQILNAVPTAEGALAIAIREMRVMLFGCRAAVIGFGRCGRVLAARLKALGVHVTVAARKPSDLAFAEVEGYEVLHSDDPSDLQKLASGYDLLCNTVPARLFDAGWVMAADRKTLCLELASAPGAFDTLAAEAAGLRLIVCPALPGRFSPDTAGRLILRTILGELRGPTGSSEPPIPTE